MKLPQRKSLTADTVEVIQEMIALGEFKQKLPGERELAARLQIGRDTLRTSLAELEKKGWITVGEHGKRRSILKKPTESKQVKRHKRIGFLSPKRLEELPPTMLLELDQIREILARRDITLELHSPSVFNLQRPGARLKDLVDSVQCDAWILYQSTVPMQSWFEKKAVPCLVRGQSYPGIQLSSLDLDWQATGFHAAAMLTRFGHSSIGLIMPDTQLQGLFAAQKGIENALSQASNKASLHMISEQGTAEAVAASLHNISHADNPPTAIIATRSRQVLTLISWLASHRMRVPQNMSLISLTYDNIYNALVPKISHYTLDHFTMARGIVRKLDSVLDGTAPDEKLLIPEFVSGDSVVKLD